MIAPLGIYGVAIRQAARGREELMHVVDESGRSLRLIDPMDWTIELRPGDASLVERCLGPTLDVGCGPGRLTSALTQAGHAAIGIDISAEAVRQARRRGATALRGDVFAPVPNEGWWRSVLLADGNIGIGGNPVTLLARCRQLLELDGTVLVEVAAPGERTWTGYVRLRYAQHQSAPFAWANVSADDIAEVAALAGLHTRETWTEGQRWFAHLAT